MNQIVKTGLYEEDLHGNNPDNLVTDELHTLQVPGIDDYYFIIPRAAPFFVSSLKVFDRQTGQEYIEDVDYTIGHRFIEAMDSIGRPIAGSIRIMRRDITGTLKLTYRTIGGNWGYNDKLILDELARKQYNPIVRVWGNIGPLPYSFPPLIHDQSLDTLVGSEDLNDSLIRIGDILEATASGTTESHMNDFNNPHRVNKTQVGLGSVDNFKTATVQQTITGAAANLFVTPKGLYETLLVRVINPLSDHVNATGNVHGLHKRDIDLGNVQNYPVATNTQAVDVTNNQTYMTPYTTYLMMRDLQGGSELDNLILQLNEHLSARNPHNITAEMINTYNKQEINDLLRDAASGAFNEFGDLNPDEWKDLFPHDDDFLDLMTAISEREEAIGDLTFELPAVILPEANPNLLTNLTAQMDSYSVSNAEGRNLIISRLGIFGYDKVINNWAGAKDALYILDNDTGEILSYGDNKMATGVLPAEIGTIVASNNLFAFEGDGVVAWKTRTGGYTTIYDDFDEVKTFNSIEVHPGLNTDKPFGILLVNGTNTVTQHPFGDAAWVNRYRTQAGSPFTTLFTSMTILEDYLVGMEPDVYEGHYVRIYKLNTQAPYDITNPGTIYAVRNDGVLVAINNLAITGLIDSSGVDSVMTITTETYSYLIDFNNLTNPEWPLPDKVNVKLNSVLAGNDYIITLDNFNNVNAWGDFPDNELVYPGLKSF